MLQFPFIPGYPSETHGLLGRYLPPLPEGVAASYINRYSEPGDLILDPFGHAPQIAIEAAQLDRRIVVANRNPLIGFALDVALNPPSETLARKALTRLADAPAAGGRVEKVVRALYRTTCPNCGQTIDPEYFAWQEDALFEKRLICPNCGKDDIYPTDEVDAVLASRIPLHGPGYHWALDQVAAVGDPDLRRVSKTLEVYTPRALQAIFILTTKMQTLGLDTEAQRALHASLLVAFDEGNSLWPYPSERGRPRTLNPPQRYRERNLWLALESAVSTLGSGTPIRFTAVSELLASEQGGVALLDSSLSDLGQNLGEHRPILALATLPRPNPVLWVLSVIWASWLWGRIKNKHLRRLLRRRRYEWAWHEQALRVSFQALRENLPDEAPLIGLLPKAEPVFLSATITAADGAGYTLNGLAVQSDRPAAQLTWQAERGRRPPSVRDLPAALQQQAEAGVVEVLRERAEPTPWAITNAAALSGCAAQYTLQAATAQHGEESLPFVTETIQKGLRHARALTQLVPSSGEPRIKDLWWLTEPPPATTTSLSNKVEVIVAHLLATQSPLDAYELLAAVQSELPGLLTPSGAWVQRCLESYGQQLDDGRWECRAEDEPTAREAERRVVYEQLAQLGTSLNFQINQTSDVVLEWRDGKRSKYGFVVLSTAAVDVYLLGTPLATEQSILVIPGGRANMIQYWLQNDLRLGQAEKEHGWTFLKYRHVRRLLDESGLTRSAIKTVLGLDPIIEQRSAQIPLF